MDTYQEVWHFVIVFAKLEGNDPYVCAIRETDGHVGVYKYHTTQMLLQCVDQININKQIAKKALRKNMETYIDPDTNELWKAGNPVNLQSIATTKCKLKQDSN